MNPTARRDIVTRLQQLTTESRHVAAVFGAQEGLSTTDLDALLHVMHAQQQGDPATPGGIAEALGLTSGAATGVIDRLAKMGHVVRVRDEHDRRIVRVHFADQARDVARGFFAPLGALADEVMASYSPQELDVVTRFLGEMSEAMREHGRGPRATAEGGSAAG